MRINFLLFNKPYSRLKLFAVLLSGGFFINSSAQRAQIESADRKYDAYSYIDAISIYEKVAEKGYRSVDLFERLGNAYYFNSEFESAAHWYTELFAMKKELPAEYYYRYAQTLKSVGNYDKANVMLSAFTRQSAADLRAGLYSKQEDYLGEIAANSGKFIVSDAGINSAQSDFGAAFYGDRLVFATARDTAGIFRRKMKWNNQAFTNLYMVGIVTDSTMGKPEKFDRNINSRFNESSAVFTADGTTMYFTRNNFNDGKKGKSRQRVTLLKLYKAIYTDKGWSEPVELPFNSDQYNVAHPALSPDEKTLYFASDMPGSFGQSDLYRASIGADGTFGKPQNLGKPINTEGKETFPFVSDGNIIYFASDGHPGLGGLDIFSSKINDDGSYGKIRNIGEPINSKMDDFAFGINAAGHQGFFSSNRSGGKGSDDIYRFTKTGQVDCEQQLSGMVTDKETATFIPGASIIVSDSNFKVIASLIADDRGNYNFSLPCDARYYIKLSKEEYETEEITLTVPEVWEDQTLDMRLGKRKKIFIIGDDIGPKLGIQSIYFDLDKAVIRDDAIAELEKVFELMQSYPDLRIEVRSHTDSRQSKEYNLKLSDERAKATVDWLIRHGINRDRLSSKGYGESQLLNRCADGVECSEQEHQMNRRSEFIVRAM